MAEEGKKNNPVGYIVTLSLTFIVMIGLMIYFIMSVLFGAVTGWMVWLFSILAIIIVVGVFTANYWLVPILNTLFGKLE